MVKQSSHIFEHFDTGHAWCDGRTDKMATARTSLALNVSCSVKHNKHILFTG